MDSVKNLIITLVLTCIMSFVILWGASKVFIPKWLTDEDNRMSYIIKGFYKEDKNSLDVVFTGNSDVYRGVSPMHLYDETGITSYNFVSAGQRMWIAYPLLEEMFKTQSPKIVFFNVDEVFFQSNASIGNYHKVYDNMPFSVTKIEGVFDYNYKRNVGSKLSHFLPIFAYHSRYNELNREDFKYAFYDYTDYLKGMDLVKYNIPYVDNTDYMAYTEEVAEIPEKTKVYLDKMKELCEENKTELILFELPSADSWSYKKSNAISKYAKENNLKFIDFNLVLDEMSFDWLKDSSDGGDHLNLYGATKVTDYFVKYLNDNYDFKSHKNDKNYTLWNEQLEKYKEITE